MRIVVINPPNTPFTEKSILIEPIDILTLSTYIKSLWHEPIFLDMDTEQMLPSQIPTYFQTTQPDCIIVPFDYHIPLHRDESLVHVMEICSIAKKQWIKTIVWWKIATYKPEVFLYQDSPIDIAMAYEMELSIKKLLTQKKRTKAHLQTIENISFWKNGEVIRTRWTRQKIDIETLPIADRTLCQLDKYIDVRSILTSRGCPMKCSYCHVPDFWSTWTGRSPESIVQEILWLVQDFGTDKIIFLDDNFGADKKRMEAIADLLIQKKITCKFWFLATIHSFDEALFQKLYKAWCRRVHYGVETGDEKLSKSINKHLLNDKIKEVIQKTKDIGFRIRSSRIIDLPGSTNESIDKTTQLIMETHTDEIRLHFLSIRFGSQMYTELWDKEMDTTSQYIHHDKTHNFLHEVDPDYIQQKVLMLIQKLQDEKYICIHDIQENKQLAQLAKTQAIKIISFCPLRYWLCR